MLTVGLVVLAIFLFLRRFWATVIPSVAIPLSIIGTFGVMYLADSTSTISPSWRSRSRPASWSTTRSS